jgi:hypothetical protein
MARGKAVVSSLRKRRITKKGSYLF